MKTIKVTMRFNTVNGKHCCNRSVDIPDELGAKFQYRKR